MADLAVSNIAPSRIAHWLGLRATWQLRVLALAAGALATLGHAPFFLLPAYVVALTTLVWLLDATAARPKRLSSAFVVGFCFGLGHYLTAFNWIVSPFLVDPASWGLPMGLAAWAAFAGGLALFWGLGAVLAMLAWTQDLRRLPLFALAVFAAEWLRGHLFGGFPWILPGYVWLAGEPISQLASIVGIYGLSLLTVLVCAAPAALLDQGRIGLRLAPTLIAALALGAAWGWGRERIAAAPNLAPGAAPIVKVVESGLSQAEKWAEHPDQEWRVLSRYLAASGPPGENEILIWPEGAIPIVNFYPLENPQFLEALAHGLGDRALIMGATRREWRGDEVIHYNSAVIIDGVAGSPRIGQSYDKYRLVPFGEFIPLWSYISGFNIAPLQRIGAGFTPGAPPARMIVPEAPPAAVLICYEAIFPRLTPRGDERPGWIVNVSNDSWFGAGIGPEQHFAASRYRAIEEGLPMARAASGGISAIVDAFGRVVAEAHVGAASAQLPPALPETLYSSKGLWFTSALVALFAALRFAPLGGAATGKRR